MRENTLGFDLRSAAAAVVADCDSEIGADGGGLVAAAEDDSERRWLL